VQLATSRRRRGRGHARAVTGTRFQRLTTSHGRRYGDPVYPRTETAWYRNHRDCIAFCCVGLRVHCVRVSQVLSARLVVLSLQSLEFLGRRVCSCIFREQFQRKTAKVTHGWVISFQGCSSLHDPSGRARSPRRP